MNLIMKWFKRKPKEKFNTAIYTIDGLRHYMNRDIEDAINIHKVGFRGTRKGKIMDYSPSSIVKISHHTPSLEKRLFKYWD